MQSIKIDANTLDISTTGSNVDIVSGAQAWKQYLEQRLRLWKGEYFLDTTRGVDYANILGSKKLPSEDIFIDVIESSGYNTKVTSFNMSLGTDRKLSVVFSCTCDIGTIENIEVII